MPDFYTSRKKSPDEVREMLAFASRGSRQRVNKKRQRSRRGCRRGKDGRFVD